MSEKEKILKMVANGKISVEDGERLLRAVNENETNDKSPGNLIPIKPKKEKKTMGKGKIIIEIQSTKGENIKLNIPLKLGKLASKMIPKDRISDIEKAGIDIQDIIESISDTIDDIDEDILNISSPTGDNIRIYVER